MIPVLLSVLTVLCGSPRMEPRPVSVHEHSIVPVDTQRGYVTQINLPSGEELKGDPHVGLAPVDKGIGFEVTHEGNVVFIKPMFPPEFREIDIPQSNISLEFLSGNSVMFFVREISRVKDAHADLVIVLDEPDERAKKAILNPPYVSRTVADQLRDQLNEKDRQLQTERLNHQTQLRNAELKEALQMDCRYQITDQKGSNRFHASVCRDNEFTFVRVDTQEIPAIWEIRDKSKTLIEANLREGQYVVQHLMNEGELKVGKSSAKFEYVGNKEGL